MSAYKQQLIAVERSIKIIEELSETFFVPDTSVPALYDTYEVLAGMAFDSDKSTANEFLTLGI